MEVIRELSENKGIAVALGFFDGVHIGHKKVIQTLVAKAKEQNLKSAVITFDINPANYFNEEPVPNIMTFKDKESAISSLGVDFVYELNFEEIKDLSAQEYLENIIEKYFDPKLIVVGYNHTFGKEGKGNGEFLSQQAQKLNYELIIVPETRYNGTEEVSSSVIRKRIEHGHLNAVRALLGHSYMIQNSVIQGNKIARTLGYPTANLIWPDGMAKLPYGVYYGLCQANSKLIPALISWGTRPTLASNNNELLEVHLYKFDENLYGKIIKVLFVKKVRDQKNFGNIRELGEQVKKDYAEFSKWVANSRIQ